MSLYPVWLLEFLCCCFLQIHWDLHESCDQGAEGLHGQPFPFPTVEKPSSLSIDWRYWAGNTPFHVLERCRILECNAESTCLYALQNT